MKTTIVKMKNGSFAVQATLFGFFKNKTVYLCNWQDSLAAVLKVDGVTYASDWDSRTAEFSDGRTKPILNYKTGEDAENGLKLYFEQKAKEKKEYEERVNNEIRESRDYDCYFP